MGRGGGRLGVPRVGTRDPRHGLGGPYTRKNFLKTQLQIHTHSGHNTQRSFDPPPQKRVPRCGGYLGQNPKNHWGIIFGPKMMILHGVRRQKPYIEVCYANDPKKGGHTTLAPALDVTTSLQGDLAPLAPWPPHRYLPKLGGGGGWGVSHKRTRPSCPPGGSQRLSGPQPAEPALWLCLVRPAARGKRMGCKPSPPTTAIAPFDTIPFPWSTHRSLVLGCLSFLTHSCT